jgi:hypothetical protein
VSLGPGGDDEYQSAPSPNHSPMLIAMGIIASHLDWHPPGRADLLGWRMRALSLGIRWYALVVLCAPRNGEGPVLKIW